jgi:hypothetical protein
MQEKVEKNCLNPDCKRKMNEGEQWIPCADCQTLSCFKCIEFCENHDSKSYCKQCSKKRNACYDVVHGRYIRGNVECVIDDLNAGKINIANILNRMNIVLEYLKTLK